MFLSNIALCNGIPDTVTEWVQKYEIVEQDPTRGSGSSRYLGAYVYKVS